jgi:hypothetical protein
LDQQALVQKFKSLSAEQKAALYKSDDAEGESTNPILVAKKFYQDTLASQENELRKSTEGINLPWEKIDNMKKNLSFPNAKEMLDKS